MGIIPENKVDDEEVGYTEMNLLRNLGFIVDLNAGETIAGATLPVPVYIDATENEWMACDANVLTKLEFLGFAISSSTNGNPIQVQKTGVVGGFTGLTIGDPCYVQDDGTIGHSMGTYEVLVGYAVSATQILIQKGKWEYMGSVSDTADAITAPAGARFAIIQLTGGGMGGYSLGGQVTLAKIGATSVTLYFNAWSLQHTQLSASWSGNTITLSHSGDGTTSVAGTANFYR